MDSSTDPGPHTSPEPITQRFPPVVLSTPLPIINRGAPSAVNFSTRAFVSSVTHTSPLPPGELSTATPDGDASSPGFPSGSKVWGSCPATPALQTSLLGGFALQTSKTAPPLRAVATEAVRGAE